MHHLTCGISSLLHSVNLILFTVLLVHLILRIITSSESPPSGVARKFSQGVRNSNYLQSSTYHYCFWTTANIVYCLLVLAQVFSESPPTTRRNQKARFQNSNRLKLSTNVLEVMR